MSMAYIRKTYGVPAKRGRVVEVWGDPEAHLALGAVGWVLMSGESRVADVVYPSPAGTTEAEALVAALEAAP